MNDYDYDHPHSYGDEDWPGTRRRRPSTRPRGATKPSRISHPSRASFLRDVLAESEDNDPFYCGREAHVADAEWFLGIWKRFAFAKGSSLLNKFTTALVVQGDVLMRDGGHRHTSILITAGRSCKPRPQGRGI